MQLKGGGLKGAPGIRRNEPESGMRLMVVLVALSLVMFTASARESQGGFFTTLRGGFSTVAMPIRYLGSVVTVPFQGLGNVFANLTADQATLQELREQNEQLTTRNAQLEEAEKTATRLQDLLALKSSYKLQSTAARIISGSTDSWSRTVTIDKGSASGLAVGMPVTNSAGAIGQIVECGATSSTVRLVSDENSSVSAMVQSSRAQGILTGSPDGTLRLTLIATDQTVAVGDTVVTSGLGGVFPKGLPLGKVISVNKTEGALYYEIAVEGTGSAEGFEEVLVVTSLTEDQEATAEDIKAADEQDSSVTAAAADKAGSAKDGDAGTSADGSDAASGNGE